jgi:hypothetical protein
MDGIQATLRDIVPADAQRPSFSHLRRYAHDCPWHPKHSVDVR